MNFKRNIFTTLALSTILGLSFTGCTDEIELYPGAGNSEMEVPSEPSLQFDFNLTPMGDNSAGVTLDHGEEWENYIDPAKLRVLFFDMKGKYLFEVDHRYISTVSKDNHWTGATEAYRVTIPQRGLFPAHREGMDDLINARLNEDFRKALMEDGFKVAVLANWPYFVEGQRQYDPITGDPILQSSMVPSDLHMTYVPEEEGGPNQGSYISDFAHSTFDNVYGVSRNTDGTYQPIPTKAYEHICLFENENDELFPYGGRMDVYSVWVKSFYQHHSDAEDFIRAGLDTDGAHFSYSCSGEKDSFTYTDYSYTRTDDENNTYKMENIWRLWNFSAGEVVPYNQDSNKIFSEGGNSWEYWQARNNNALIWQLHKITGDDNKLPASGFDVVSLSSKASNLEFNEAGGYLRVPTTMSSGDKPLDMISDFSSSDDKVRGAARTKFDDYETKALHFRAYGEGTLSIKARATGNGKIVVITSRPGVPNSESVVYAKNVTYEDGKIVSMTNPEEIEENVYLKPAANINDIPPHGYMYILTPNSDPYLDVYIGAYGGTVDFYEIEYIRDRHVYDSGRTAIMPSADNPIPMYGVQNFDPIGDFITPNTTFNMSSPSANQQLPSQLRDTYNYKDVFLLRSLAKVELKFRRSVFKNNPPEHVFMRVLNRSARCAPKDLKNPTEWAWFGADEVNRMVAQGKNMSSVPAEADPSSFPGIDQEFANIISYGHMYDPSQPNESKATSPELIEAARKAYQDKTAWFHAIWTKRLDNPTNHALYCWNKEWDWNYDYTHRTPNIDNRYTPPRIFNTRIDRSDYARMHHVHQSIADEYIRYVMYLPEKNLDDTDDKGFLGSSPKICHIEVRFEGMNEVLNYDDDNCYRIYFTDYNTNGEYMQNLQRNNYFTYEKDDNFLRRLQPIMRNCHYVFTIDGINANGNLNINYSVCGAANRNMAGPITFN